VAGRIIARAEGPAVPHAWLSIARADQSIVERNPRAAVELLLGLSSAPPTLVPVIRLGAVRGLLACADPGPARALLAPLLAPQPPDIATEAWLLDALAADQLGLEGAVCIALGKALEAAAPEAIRRPFLSSGRSAIALLDRHRDLVRVHGTLADRLLASADRRPEPGLVEPITERETVVLRYLPTLLTAREIASELYVSPNTIKTQVKSIYRKLSVQTRRAAVDRARRLGLL
jgi:LuxR family maltose regulon positive regulatory protein